MSKILYLDCPTGIAGDMLLSSLLELGADREKLLADLRLLPLGDWEMELTEVSRGGIKGLHLDFTFPHQHHHRHYRDIKAMLEDVTPLWPAAAAVLAKKIFAALAEAEAYVHGCAIDEVHFHEAGAVDSVLDICGAALVLTQMQIDQVYFSPLPLSEGFVDCEHGRLPLPAPAAAKLMEGLTLIPCPVIGETVTPTGAAILKGCSAIQDRPAMKLLKCGHGAGTKDFPAMPNILRAMLGEADGESSLSNDTVEVLRTNIDDASGELLGQLWEKAFALGALDMSYTPLMMKKGRPGWALEMIVPDGKSAEFARLIFRHTTTIGLRVSKERRLILPRRVEKIRTVYGDIAIKISGDTAAPEAEQVAAAAEKHGVSFKLVYEAAAAAFFAKQTKEQL